MTAPSDGAVRALAAALAAAFAEHDLVEHGVDDPAPPDACLLDVAYRVLVLMDDERTRRAIRVPLS